MHLLGKASFPQGDDCSEAVSSLGGMVASIPPLALNKHERLSLTHLLAVGGAHEAPVYFALRALDLAAVAVQAGLLILKVVKQQALQQ